MIKRFAGREIQEWRVNGYPRKYGDTLPASQIINPSEMRNQTIFWSDSSEMLRISAGRSFDSLNRNDRCDACTYACTCERFDRDRNAKRKIRLNDESGAKFAAAYRKRERVLSLSTLLLSSLPLSLLLAREFVRSLAREFRRRNFASARSLPKAFKRIKFSRIVYDKMFPFNLSNHRRAPALQTFANLAGGRE